MSSNYECVVVRRTRATPQTLFDIVADGSRWATWARPLISYSAWETLGPQGDGGVGAIRAVGARQRPNREMVTVHEPPSRHGYTILDMKAIQDYRGDVSFTEDGGETRVVWQSHFGSRNPLIGRAYWALVRFVIGTLSSKLVKAAEEHDRAG